MTKIDEDIAAILAEYQVRFYPEALSSVPDDARVHVVLKSLKIINVIDCILIAISIMTILGTNFTLSIFTVIAGGLIGFSGWRIVVYRLASRKIRKLV